MRLIDVVPKLVYDDELFIVKNIPICRDVELLKLSPPDSKLRSINHIASMFEFAVVSSELNHHFPLYRVKAPKVDGGSNTEAFRRIGSVLFREFAYHKPTSQRILFGDLKFELEETYKEFRKIRQVAFLLNVDDESGYITDINMVFA